VKTDLSYDGLNRVTSLAYTGETGYQTPAVTYTYSETETGFFNNGRLTKVQTAAVPAQGTPATVQNYRYDSVGQINTVRRSTLRHINWSTATTWPGNS
jgi:hypothetical protein